LKELESSNVKVLSRDDCYDLLVFSFWGDGDYSVNSVLNLRLKFLFLSVSGNISVTSVTIFLTTNFYFFLKLFANLTLYTNFSSFSYFYFYFSCSRFHKENWLTLVPYFLRKFNDLFPIKFLHFLKGTFYFVYFSYLFSILFDFISC